MSTDDILRAAIECQLITTGNRDSFYAAALVRFANLVRTESLGEQPARVPLTEGELLSMWSGGDERFMRPVLGKNKILAFALAVIAAYEAKNGIGGGK